MSEAMLPTVSPTETQPTRSPSPAMTGTIVRTLGPSVPVNSSVTEMGREGIVPRYGRPISPRSRCVTRTPSGVMIVTKSTPASAMTDSAKG